MKQVQTKDPSKQRKVKREAKPYQKPQMVIDVDDE
jgi:hypothetical protein